MMRGRFCLKTFLLILQSATSLIFGDDRRRLPENIVFIVHMDNEYYAKNGGSPPADRNAYLPLIDAVKTYKPKILFLGINFARQPLASELMFASQANKDNRLILPFTFSSDKYEENFEMNRKNLYHRIAAIELPTDVLPEPMKGIILPYPDIVAKSLQTCASAIYPDEDRIVRSFYGYFFYKNYAFLPASLCILQHYLRDMRWELALSGNFEELKLIHRRNGKATFKKKIAGLMKGDQEVPIPIVFQKLQIVSAQAVLEKKVKIPEGRIILVGPTADGVADWSHTPVGLLPNIDVLGHEVNTLWQMIKNDIPREK